MRGAPTKSMLQREYAKAQQVGQRLWHSPPSADPTPTDDNPCAQIADLGAKHIAARKQSTRTTARVQVEKTPQVTLHNKSNRGTLDTVLNEIYTREEPPNTEQRHLLEAFVQRMKTERLEDLQHKKHKASDPLFDIIHGYPGTGKSRIIAWLRELMEEGLGWSHGTEFVCLAFQNAMAALIDGYTTIHR